MRGLNIGLEKNTPWYLQNLVGGTNPSLWFDYTNNRYVVNQVEKSFDDSQTFTGADNGTYIDANGAVVVTGTDEERLDYTTGIRGLLMNRERTNVIENNTMVGANAGTDTVPTRWNVSNSSTFSYSVEEVGTENGVEYIDLRIYGNTNSTGDIQFRFENFGSASASTAYTGGFYVKVVSGSTSGFNYIHNRQTYFNGGAYSSQSQEDIKSSITSTLTRTSHTGTTTGVTNRIDHLLAFKATDNGLDVTIRIGLPQLEEGSFATSVIKTDNNDAVTRTADLDLVNGVTWFNSDEGTFIFEVQFQGFENLARVMEFRDATGNNSIIIYLNTSGQVFYEVKSASSIVANITYGTSLVANTTSRIGVTYKANEFKICIDGGVVSEDTSGAVPSNLSDDYIGNRADAARGANAYFFEKQYYERAFTDAELQSVTSF